MSRAAWQISPDLEAAPRVRGQKRGSDFLRPANAFATLYPKGSEEKRLIEATLLAVPR